MRNPLRSFGVRVTLAIVVSMLILVLVSNSMIYQFTFKTQIETLRNYLKTIAQTSAALINASYLEDIPLSAQGVQTESYRILTNQLSKIKDANSKIKYIYILSRTSDGKSWRFVVDVDTPGSAATPGLPYDASRFSEMVKAYDSPSADLKVESDEWGKPCQGMPRYAMNLEKPPRYLALIWMRAMSI